MDSYFDSVFDESTDIWHKVMDQLIELKEWQRMQEEVVRERQSKQIDSLTQQNTKLNALKNNLSNDENHTIDDDMSNQCHPNLDQQINGSDFDDSIEQMRNEDNCHQTSDNQSFGTNTSYLESSPIIPGIDGNNVKTFEELLNIRLNDKNVNSVESNESKPKKPFLRKGEGIKRFESNKYQTKDNQKRVCFKTNEIKDFSDKSKISAKPKYSAKEFLNKRKANKNLQNCEKPKPFLRKVIPLTAKIDKKVNKSVEITRNTPTVVLNGFNESESELFEYLTQMYENISLENSSIDDSFKDRDINELQDLLKKIEMKRERVQRNISHPINSHKNEYQLDLSEKSTQIVTKSGINSKKKVHWNQIQSFSDEESDEQIDNNLLEPKPGAYSTKLEQQINELEVQLSRLKNTKRDQIIDNSVPKNNDSLSPVCDELIKLRQQIEKLNQRIINIESKAYDLSSSQQRDRTKPKERFKCFVQTNCKTPKTIRSPTTSQNVLVNEDSNQTTIDFPNGDKMTVSKDNTILYSFANGTTQTTYPDGFKITHFPNGQTEKVDKNGVKRITYSNGLQRIINGDSSEEMIMTDGTVWRIYSDGSEVLEFSNGDREIRTNKYKRREYRNGNIKTLYSDGTEETRYINGRLRIKDKLGNLMVDSMVKHLNQHL